MAISDEQRRMMESVGIFLPTQYSGGKKSFVTPEEHIAKWELRNRRNNYAAQNEMQEGGAAGGALAPETWDPSYWNPNSSSAGGLTWDQMVAQGGYKPVYHESSLFDQVMGIAKPLAMTAGAGYGLTNLAGMAGLGAPAGTASVGASGAGGSVAGAGGGAAGGGSLGGGISLGSSASGIGGGSLGTGLTAGTTATGVGGGALGTGIGAGAAGAGALGALGPGFFAAETAYPALGGPTITGSSSVGAGAAGGGVSGGAATGTGVAGIGSKVLSNPQFLGMAGGALLSGMGGGSGPAGTTTTETDMPDWLKGYVRPALDKYSTMVQNYNTDPYGVMPAAMQEFQKTISGGYLDPSTNKYLEDYFNAGAERVKGTLSPSFGHMQAFGSHTGYNEALSRGLADLSTGLYGQAYENERSRQNQMIGAAPNFLQASSQQAFAPYQGYLSTVGGLGGSKTTQPYFKGSDWQNILGGAMTGWGLGNIFK